MKRPILLLSVAVMSAGCGPEPDQEVSVVAEELRAHPEARWVSLGGDLNQNPSFLLSPPALALERHGRPVLAFSSSAPVTYAESTSVSTWNGSDWVRLGSTLEGARPALVLDGHSRPMVCLGSGPFLKRWAGHDWADVGSDISLDTGYRRSRYMVSGCEGVVLDSRDRPTVAWSADVGAKANYVYVAQWSHREQRWGGLGDAVGPRATAASLDIDEDDRVYLATFKPGLGYGGQETVRVFRWDDGSWEQLGPDMLHAREPAMKVDGHRVYLAYSSVPDRQSATIQVAQWSASGWRSIAPDLPGSEPRIQLSHSGQLVMAYVHSEGFPAERSRQSVRVVRRSGQRWLPVGDELADVTSKRARLSLTMDAAGHPIVAWSEDAVGEATYALFVKRFTAPVH